ncbi:MAG: hypothetical protein LBB62_07120, partial [Proteiniphilum sp.]|nr:hypothetical protein [Proteiniphilum sp.]
RGKRRPCSSPLQFEKQFHYSIIAIADFAAGRIKNIPVISFFADFIPRWISTDFSAVDNSDFFSGILNVAAVYSNIHFNSPS